MIPDDTVDRYYYIFDSRERRALVMDRLTGEEYAWEEAPRTQLIDWVRTQRTAQCLRRFARWCARRMDVGTAPLHTATGRLWAAVRQQGDPGTMTRARADATDAAVLAAAAGLPSERSSAARLLAVYACTHPSARRAALDAAHMNERWAEFEAETAPTAAVRTVRQRHIDWLLDSLGTS